MKAAGLFSICLLLLIFCYAGCNYDCDITCVTSTNSSESLIFSYDTIVIDENDEDAARDKCIEEAESKNIGNTKACWGYTD